MHRQQHAFTKWALRGLGIAAAFLILFVAPMARAADTVTASYYMDTNGDGTVDQIRWVMDETVVSCAYEAGDWTVNVPGDITVAITGLSCTGANANLDILVTADAFETSSAINPSISYADAGTAGSVMLAGAMTAKGPVAVLDGAAPVISQIGYFDNSGPSGKDGKIDTIRLTFSESVTGASVVSLNDVTATVGDFTSMVVGPDATDLITGSQSYVDLTVATPSTVADTHDDSGTFMVTTQNAFSLTDGTNVNTTLAAQTQAVVADYASPAPVTVTAEDIVGNDGKLDTIVIDWSENLGVLADASSYFSISGADFSALTETGAECNSGSAGAAQCFYYFTTSTIKTDLGNLSLYHDTSVPAIQDAYGNTVTVSRTFDSASAIPLLDGARPVIVSTTPADAAVNVSRTAAVAVTFSEPMDTTFAYATEFSLTLGANPGGWVVTPSNLNKTFSLAHTAFAASTAFTLDFAEGAIDAAAGTVTALNNANGLDVVDFTTAAAGGGGGGGTLTPSVLHFYINNDAPTTTGQIVSLDMLVNYASQMLICNDAGFAGCTWEPYVSPKTWTLTSGAGEKTVYARFRSSTGTDSSLRFDTIQLLVSATTPPPTEPTPSTGAGAYVAPSGSNTNFTTGTWVKIAANSAVYFVDALKQRHAYPNQAVWESYFGTDFSRVTVISTTEMATMSLGRNVPFNYGTLLKIPSVTKVYVVDGNATLRWITTEALAAKYFGANWATKVHDLNEAFFPDYSVMLPITE